MLIEVIKSHQSCWDLEEIQEGKDAHLRCIQGHAGRGGTKASSAGTATTGGGERAVERAIWGKVLLYLRLRWATPTNFWELG